MRNFTDKNGKPLQPGQLVRVKWCVGIYGQTRTVAAVLQSIDQHGGLGLKLAESASFRQDRGRFGTAEIRPGDTFYVAMHWTHKGDTSVGYYQHNDIEHHHETWIEIQEG